VAQRACVAEAFALSSIVKAPKGRADGGGDARRAILQARAEHPV
jgi:hypothetical protein